MRKAIIIALLLVMMPLAQACGIRPGHLKPPSGVPEEQDTFPRAYPAASTAQK